jgi:peptide chain release factor 2
MVEVVPEVERSTEIQLNEADLRIDVYRAGGHGGQSVNTTDSAVRITHIPSGVSVAIQNERSQLQNRETAMKILLSKLTALAEEQHQAELSQLKGPNQEAAWGNQIRSYVLHPYTLVKDTRSGYQTSNVAGLLDGELDECIQAYLHSNLSLSDSSS